MLPAGDARARVGELCTRGGRPPRLACSVSVGAGAAGPHPGRRLVSVGSAVEVAGEQREHGALRVLQDRDLADPDVHRAHKRGAA